MDELLPCPFCGNKPFLRHGLSGNHDRIYCDNPDCSANMEIFGSAGLEPTIKKWNTRIHPANSDPSKLTVKDVCKLPEKLSEDVKTYNQDYYKQSEACGYNHAIQDISSLPVQMPEVGREKLAIIFHEIFGLTSKPWEDLHDDAQKSWLKYTDEFLSKIGEIKNGT